MDDLLTDDDEPTAPFWMATFSDMMTLLLTFFVMLVAMSSVEIKRFEEALSYFTGRRGLMEQEGLMPGIMGVTGEPNAREQAETFEEIATDVQELGLGDAVNLDLTDRGVRVTFMDSVAFAPGSVALAGPARAVLDEVGRLARSARSVEVEGHTDDRPIATAAYPSNWELSAARAASVVRYLLSRDDALEPDRYVAVGYGEHRPRDTNDTAEGRARNRRITVLFRTTDTDDSPTLFPVTDG